MKTEISPETKQCRITSIQIGPNAVKDTIAVEAMLMKLAMAKSVISEMNQYILGFEVHGGTVPEHVEVPDYWAVEGMFENLDSLAHALTCVCWGYKVAGKH